MIINMMDRFVLSDIRTIGHAMSSSGRSLDERALQHDICQCEESSIGLDGDLMMNAHNNRACTPGEIFDLDMMEHFEH